MVLQIWRKTGQRKSYEKIGDIALPSMCNGNLNISERCGQMQPQSDCDIVYECILKRRMNVTVQPQDILGIKLPPKDRVRFELYFIAKSRPMLSNYIFERTSNSPTTINLNNHINITAVQPLIIIEVEPGIKLASYSIILTAGFSYCCH